MKITNRVQCYIQDRVKQAYLSKVIDPEYDAYETKRKELMDFADAECKKLSKVFSEKIKALGIEEELGSESISCRVIDNSYRHYGSICKKHDDLIRNAECDARKKADEIILEVELGGNKETLDRLLAEIEA